MANTSTKPRVLLVADDVDLSSSFTTALNSAGYEVNIVNSFQNALGRIGGYRPHIVVIDSGTSGGDNLAVGATIQDHCPGLPVIVLTAYEAAPEQPITPPPGIFGYLAPPVDESRLLDMVNKALRSSNKPAPPEADPGDPSWRRDIVSRSPVMESVLREARAAAATDADILILSQAGAGKELLARAIHKASRRSGRPFVALDCSTMPEPMVESQLFGHGNGVPTGTNREHSGLFQGANGGTVFLDGIADMSPALQARVLNVVERREVHPPGVAHSVAVDVRIISATHQDLENRVRQKMFDEDLYRRLNTITLELPPLEQRRGDIAPLAEHFLQLLSRKYGKAIQNFSPPAMELLFNAAWPGNVRQLLNVVEQCVVLATTSPVPPRLVQRALRGMPDKLLSLDKARAQFERDYIMRILQLTEGNVALAARLAERNRSEFYKILKRHGLEPAQFRTRTH